MEKKFHLTEKVKKEIFQLITDTMEKDGVSQGEIARRIGSARPNINKIFRKKEAVTIDFLLKIAECLGLEVEIKLIVKKRMRAE